MTLARTALLVVLAFPAGGCAIGHNRMLFFTKTNMGLDVDSQPATAEITIARREGVIEPTFEGGQTLPVLASFTSENNAAQRLFGGVGMTFATGEAAVALAKYHGQEDVAQAAIDAFHRDREDVLQVTEEPKSSGWLGMGTLELYGPGEMAPLVFGTDSSLGLKVGVTGQGSAGAPTLALGFRRKELAWSPITMTAGTAGFEVRTPSLLATLDSNYQGEADTEGAKVGLKYVQYFATGKAATYLATKRDVREPVLARIIPDTKPTAAGGLKDNQERAKALAERTQLFAIPSRANGFEGDDDALAEARDEARSVLVAVHNCAVELGYLSAGIDGIEKLKTPEEVRAALGDALAARAKDLKDNSGLMKNVLNALLALLDANAF